MFIFGRAFGLVIPILALGVLGACSAGKQAPGNLDPQSSGGAGGGTTGGASGSAGSVVVTGGSGGVGGGGGSINVGGSTSGASGAAAAAGAGMIMECAGDVTVGMPIPVDIYVMLDISHSMVDPVPAKWDSVKAALGAFFGDAQSAGLSVAIQYFPLPVPGVPATCTTNEQCGAAAPCVLNICKLNTPGALVTCDPADTASCTGAVLSDDGPCAVEPGASAMTCHLSGKPCAAATDCQAIATVDGKPTGDSALGACVDYGVCANDNTYSCADTNPTTNPKGCGTALGACITAASSFCSHDALCDPADYQKPAVDFLTLPDTANALSTSIAAQVPAGATPSRPALRGAIAHAREWSAAHVGHSVLVLLATDGLPTDCTGGHGVFGADSPSALADVIATATEGFTPAVATSASIQTFVIGVFAAAETTAQSNLDQIAKAGGSDHAYVINDAGNVQQDFLTALAQIRASRLTCEFQMPMPMAGATVDPLQVNVQLTLESKEVKQLYYVDPGKCTGADDEWFYDDPAKPTKLIACPKSCDMIKATTNAQVNVVAGCKIKIKDVK